MVSLQNYRHFQGLTVSKGKERKEAYKAFGITLHNIENEITSDLIYTYYGTHRHVI